MANFSVQVQVAIVCISLCCIAILLVQNDVVKVNPVEMVPNFFCPSPNTTESQVKAIDLIREQSCQKIFFVTVTSERKLAPVRSCSVISAARVNPNFCVIYLCNYTGTDQFHTTAIPANLYIYKLNMKDWFIDTPLLGWYENSTNNTNWYHALEVSDALRLAILYKIGGIYLDTDIISLNPIANGSIGGFAVWAETGSLCNCALEFPKFSPFLLLVMRAWITGFEYGKQGPDLITKAYLAHTKMAANITCDKYHVHCYDKLTPLSPSIAFPVIYQNFGMYYQKMYRAEVETLAKRSTFAHIWMAMLVYTNQRNRTIEDGSFLSDLLNGPLCR